LNIAADSGDYAKTEAASFLADIVCLQKRDYRRMVRLSLRLHQEYPGNLDFVRTLCLGYDKLHEYDKVVQYSDQCIAGLEPGRSVDKVLPILDFTAGEPMRP